ncbi:MAG: PHP domain-containing protein [Bacteroidales bacterium]|nr:PHP domain-containing protein [Bacteroidales bacterium]
MTWFKADLHIHTVLSPCADLNMSPVNIIKRAKEQNLDIIGVTDHNSTLHCEIMARLGKKNGISVFTGVEVNTREEVHCLAFFEELDDCKAFQMFINRYLPPIKNNPEKLGDQVVVNEKNEIVFEVEELLILGLRASISEVENEVHRLNGLFIPAHINRPYNSLFSQLGFVPKKLCVDALEIAKTGRKIDEQDTDEYCLIQNSDAHFIENIGTSYFNVNLKNPTFGEFKKVIVNREKQNIELGS